MLTPTQLFSLLPLIILSASATLLMLSIAFLRRQSWNIIVAISGLVLALAATFFVSGTPPQAITELMVVDRFACFFIALMILVTLACTTLAHTYLQTQLGNREELYLLMMLSVVGGIVLVTSRHLASLFIGLEILSIPLYALVAYSLRNTRSLEAGIKYLVLSATSSALMLFGMALLYAYLGTLSFVGMGQQLSLMGEVMNPIILIGSLLIVVSLAFKLSLAPFHLWTPDVYEGAPAPVGAFLATVAKIAVAAAFIRLIDYVPVFEHPAMQLVLMVIAIISMLAGNLLAITQNNIKRLLAYSSIAHFGYLLVALVAFNFAMREAFMVYLLVYVLTTLAAFGVVSLVSSPLEEGDADNILLQYRGLYWRQPTLAIILTIALLSLAGIPLTAGFIGKFYLIVAGVNATLWWLLAALVIGSAIGIYYYLRVTIMLYQTESIGVSASDVSATDTLSLEDSRAEIPLSASHITSYGLLVVIAVLIILLGVFPQPMFDLVMQGDIF